MQRCFIFVFNWGIVALQCYGDFLFTRKWTSHMYTYVPSFPPKVEGWVKGLSVTLTCSRGLMYLLHSVSTWLWEESDWQHCRVFGEQCPLACGECLQLCQILSCLWFYVNFLVIRASLVTQLVKNLPALGETWVRSLGRDDPLEWPRKWLPVFLPGEFHGQKSLAGCSTWCCKELDMTEQLTFTSFTFSSNSGR